MRSDRERLLDIHEAIEKILSRAGQEQSSFNTDEMLQVWIVHYLQIIGEAASRLSTNIRDKNLQVEWGQIIGMRHVLVHGYFDVDLEIVWNAVEVNLPLLREQVEEILHQLDTSNESDESRSA